MKINLKSIKLMNDFRMNYLNKINKDIEKNLMISKILEDDACFFKLNKDDSINILKTIGITQNIQETYNELISPNNYFYLKNAGKIKENDEEIKIKYNSFYLKK